ncbi:MAG TPA: chemotaxis protein CheX [Bryobacteraceae bacterium]|nr:chemotaxis protein CheX [Bryobacteraceae bacterium]
MSERLNQSCAVASDPDFSSTLSRVSAEVLETMFFDEPVAARCEHSWISSAASVRLSFEGSHRGEFLLSVSPQVARSIAPAFLGIEADEVTGTQASQVLLELANILCGSVLSRLWPDSDLRLGAPEPIQAAGSIQPATLHECFLLTDGMLSVSIQMYGAEPE